MLVPTTDKPMQANVNGRQRSQHRGMVSKDEENGDNHERRRTIMNFASTDAPSANLSRA
jgi:hypothetical protein